MRELELLAPAGSPEILKSVINAGADAVYVGGDKFGARAYATNFTTEDLLWAIDYVHACGKKMYLTVNTLLKNKEIEQELYAYILPLYQAGLDAVLVQDYGVLRFLHTYFPDLPLHASTQMTVSSKEGAAFLKSLGVERVVVSRELSLKEMKEIHDSVGVELEAFVHGALCYSYSGACLFSSVLGGRSGNRGRCAQPCRMNYTVLDNDEKQILQKNVYILSLKDACNYEKIDELKEAGIYSLKIEGRMKQVEYAYHVTKIYAQAVNGNRSKDAVEQLKEFGNRGGFTNAYLYRNNDSDMVTYKDSSLHKSDYLPAADCKEKRWEATGFLRLQKGLPARLEVSCKDNHVVVEKNPVEEAKNVPLIAKDVLARMNKTGNEHFDFTDLQLDMSDDIFVPNGVLNAMRREALEALYESMLSQYRRNQQVEFSIRDEDKNSNHNLTKWIASVRDRKQLSVLLRYKSLNAIYLHASMYEKNHWITDLQEDVNAVIAAEKECYLIMPEVLRNRDAVFFEEHHAALVQMKLDGFVVCNTDSLGLCRRLFPQSNLIAEHSLYTMNNRAIDELSSHGIMHFTAPLELNRQELQHRDNQTSEFVIYGRYPLMQSAGCVCKNTKGCHNPQIVYLSDRYQMHFPVMNHCSFCYNTVFNSLPTNLIDQFGVLREMGFSDFRLDFTTENEEEIKNILMILEDELSDKMRYNNKQSFTRGHYKRGVE